MGSRYFLFGLVSVQHYTGGGGKGHRGVGTGKLTEEFEGATGGLVGLELLCCNGCLFDRGRNILHWHNVFKCGR